MTKKKILTLAMALSMVAILAIGGTIAYFADTDEATNVFTTGDVEIEINEPNFVENSDLIPGIPVEKDVFVTNTGSRNAFVRVHIAFPKVLDSGNPDFNAMANKLHWNFTTASLAEGQWNWNADAEGSYYPGNGGNWNSYETTINGVEYTVYVATYMTALTAGQQTTTESLTKVYLDTSITDEDLEEMFAAEPAVLEENIKIYVVAEGVQEAGFEGAPYTALNTEFGVPGTYDPFN